ncbi:MAG: zinc ribbon domain-containing protein [Syntrophaceae bacterium]
MPIYEYKCKACGNDFEKLVSFSSKDPVSCPKCASENVAKKISMVASGKSGCDGCTSTSCGPS